MQIVLVSVLLCWPSSWSWFTLLADRISRPLREFSAGIERISLDNLASDIPLLSSSYTEELQALDRAFRAMLLQTQPVHRL